MVAVYRHSDTGEIVVLGDCRWAPGEDHKCILPFRSYYPYSFPEPFSAYLVPPDLTEGERVWLKDIIEDIVSVFGNQGSQPGLESREAHWTKGDFEIQFDPKRDAPRLIG